MKKYFPALLLLISIATSCSKEDSPEEPVVDNKVQINMSISEVKPTSAQVKAWVSSELPPQELGVSWAADNEEFTNQSLEVAPEVSTTLSNLQPNTVYSVRFYAKNNGQLFYSPTKTFTTINAVYDGSIMLSTQDEVENFGDHGYQEVTGQLAITENNPGDITSLAPLKDLKKVSTLKIYNLSQLKNLHGLEQLETTGSVTISNTSSLEQVNALSGINSDLMFLYFIDNTALGSLKGLEGISYAQQVEIKYNPALKDLEGLNNLTEVADIIVQDNGITSLQGLGLQIAEEVHITGNHSLTSLDGMENLTEAFFLNIDNNNGLKTLTGLEKLEKLSGLVVYHNIVLQNLDALANINADTFGAGMISSNDQLADLCGISEIFIAAGEEDFTISQNAFNPTLADLEAGNCSNN